VKLYKDYDVLQEILDCAREDLKEQSLPKLPDRGKPDIKKVWTRSTRSREVLLGHARLSL
jgi:hypothetical protein